jgi:hypothetical protein
VCRGASSAPTFRLGDSKQHMYLPLHQTIITIMIVVRVPGYRTEMYCVSCEVRTKFTCYANVSSLLLQSSCQSSWLQIQRSGFDSRRYRIFREVVGLERSPLSLMGTTEVLLGRNISGSGLEIR